MSYGDALRVVLRGDKSAAAAYINASRRLIFNLLRQGSDTGVATARRRYNVAPGVTIDIQVQGLEATATITVATSGTHTVGDHSDLVVWARSAGMTAGIDSKHPQQILRPPEDRYDWRTYTKHSNTAGRSDGTFGAIFPKGLRHAGNIDWISADKQRISWYGPSARVWQDAYIQPRVMYGKFVFMLGRVLLDTDKYAEESTEQEHEPDQHILGAALKEINGVVYLITMQTTLGIHPTDMTWLQGGYGRYVVPLAFYPDNSAPGALYFYRLAAERDGAGVLHYRVVTNGRIKSVETSTGHPDPWCFNESASEATSRSVFNPGQLTGHAWNFAQGEHPHYPLDPDDDPAGEYDDSLPHSAVKVMTVGISEEGRVSFKSESVSVISGGPPASMASDYDGDVRQELLLTFGEDLVPRIMFDDVTLPLWEVIDAGDDIVGTKRWVLHANLRDHLYVFLVENIRFRQFSQDEYPSNSKRGRGDYVEVYLRGELVSEQHIADPNELVDHGLGRSYVVNEHKYSTLRNVPIAPSFFIYGLHFSVVDRSFAGGDEDPDSFGINHDFLGCNASYKMLAFPSTAYFGTYDNNGREGDPPAPPTLLSSFVKNGFSGTPLDFDEHPCVVACAVTSFQPDDPKAEPVRRLAVSFAVPSDDMSRSMHFFTGSTLPLLTGVGGSAERYHPLWVLGLPIKP